MTFLIFQKQTNKSLIYKMIYKYDKIKLQFVNEEKVLTYFGFYKILILQNGVVK